MKNTMIQALHAGGIPPSKVAQFARFARAAMRVGCSPIQALCLTMEAHSAASGFHWNLSKGSGLEIHTRLNAQSQCRD